MPVPSMGPVSWPARWNGWKILSCLSAAMPSPVSTTVTRTEAPSAVASKVTLPPGRPYLMEFEP